MISKSRSKRAFRTPLWNLLFFFFLFCFFSIVQLECSYIDKESQYRYRFSTLQKIVMNWDSLGWYVYIYWTVFDEVASEKACCFFCSFLSGNRDTNQSKEKIESNIGQVRRHTVEISSFFVRRLRFKKRQRRDNWVICCLKVAPLYLFIKRIFRQVNEIPIDD